ncbi:MULTISPECIES: sensor histidine kinase [Marinobacter]|jgi:signal transduction histidine kinase|uniref:histidine kinase n=1 Tax=Marinobacter nauticus (strain ATCC 700491 / DSM 11845 / VT8) TaxID=351348 RepID=A1TZD2_MARN8|nr:MULTISPECIES: ATP-binding protein [Marinobacter]ABM18101.1 integral membrane sensor signal transduction histidine kinase [Marinobacter nauticus VT8]MEC8896948.1 ATP-binding protein [Pseudomonadota bacterium]MEC9041337.1 ATP-binding protein [Pseudomonadota bacterium]
MGLSVLRTLYARLAIGLFLLLLVVGGLFTLLSLASVREYSAAVNQQLNRNLAQNLVSDRNLVTDGQLNRDALKQLFELYMTINPSLEIYLLDTDGAILAYSADPDRIKRNRVSLGPIQTLLENPDAYPLPGDDPRSHDRQKVFSVTPVPSAIDPAGYLYVVLRGEEFDLAESMVHSNRLLQMGAGALAVSLLVGLLAGLVFFRMLTRRLSRLTERVESFERELSSEQSPPLVEKGDDIDYLASRFDLMARRIVAQLDLLKHKDAQRRQLVAQVSHDLRTPLASIQGYLEALRMKHETLEAEERGRFLAVALSETHRLGRQVEELFELAALDAREKQPDIEPFVMAELLYDVVQKHRPAAERAGVELTISATETESVLADIAMTERVLDNLISNAIDHSPRNTRVILTMSVRDGGAEITVADGGPGIRKEDLGQVFDPFYQAAGAERTGHAGLGLAIAQRLVVLQQGRLSAHNANGAVFTLWLPLASSS